MRDKFWKIWDKYINLCAQKAIFGIGIGLGLFACTIVLLSQYIYIFKAGAIWTGSIGFLLSTIALYLSARSHQRQESILKQLADNQKHSIDILTKDGEDLSKILKILESGTTRVLSSDGKIQVDAVYSRLVSIVLFAMKKANEKPKKNIDYTRILPEYTVAIKIVTLNIFAAFPDDMIEGHIGMDNAFVVRTFADSLKASLKVQALLNKFQHDDNEHLVKTAIDNIKEMTK